MKTQDDVAVAAGDSLDPGAWQALDELMARVGPRFFRVETRKRVVRYVAGLLLEVPFKNGWTIAEHAGAASPDGMQRLLNKAVWDHDGVRDDVREFVVERLAEPEAVLAIDETGDLKRGEGTVGVQRQYTGTAGRIENSQVAVYCAYVAAGAYSDRWGAAPAPVVV